jgi:hypothetical protein
LSFCKCTREALFFCLDRSNGPAGLSFGSIVQLFRMGKPWGFLIQVLSMPVRHDIIAACDAE